MKNGGARAGAGRKKGVKLKRTIKLEIAADVYREELRPYLKKVAETLAKMAIGRDIQAIKEYNLRTLGNVKEQVEHSGGVVVELVTYGTKKNKDTA